MKQKIIFLTIISVLPLSTLVAADTSKDLNKKGIQLGEKKQYDESIKEFDKAIEISDKSSAQIYHNRAWAQELKGDIKSAITNYEEALKRNPKQFVSGEKLGFLYYRTGDYDNAVRIGEFVIKNDPKNIEVPKWLPDAYLKKLQRLEEAERERKKKEEADKNKKIAETIKKDEDEKKKRQILLATFDFTLKTGYYFRNQSSYKLVQDPGLISDVPESLNIMFTPVPEWLFFGKFENPHLGAAMPDVVIHNETFEAAYKLSGFLLGAGIMFNHYNNNIAFARDISTWDFKVGVIFGFSDEKEEFLFRFYPRLILYDGSASTGYTYDADMVEMKYTYSVNPALKYYSVISARDYYIFDHAARKSDYWGSYGLNIGITLGKIDPKATRLSILFSAEYTLRIYLRDLDNTNPYSFGNGQGWMGLNTSKWLKGSPFSGFRSLGHEIGFKAEEYIQEYIFIYQRFSIEVVSQKEDHHEFNLQLGIGGRL